MQSQTHRALKNASLAEVGSFSRIAPAVRQAPLPDSVDAFLHEQNQRVAPENHQCRQSPIVHLPFGRTEVVRETVWSYCIYSRVESVGELWKLTGSNQSHSTRFSSSPSGSLFRLVVDRHFQLLLVRDVAQVDFPGNAQVLSFLCLF